MAKYGSPSIAIAFDNSGGTPVTISQDVLDINGIEIETLLEESQTFGDSWFESLSVGIRKLADVTIGGFYDDTASTGPNVLFNDLANGPSATTRTLTVTWGGAKTTSVETLIMKYSRMPKRNGITRYTVVLRPTGAVTEV